MAFTLDDVLPDTAQAPASASQGFTLDDVLPDAPAAAKTPPAHSAYMQFAGPADTLVNAAGKAVLGMGEGLNTTVLGAARKLADPETLWQNIKDAVTPHVFRVPGTGLPPAGNAATDKIDSLMRASNAGTVRDEATIDTYIPPFVPNAADNPLSRGANWTAQQAAGMVPLAAALVAPEAVGPGFALSVQGGASKRARMGGATPEQQGNIALDTLPASVLASEFGRVGERVGGGLGSAAARLEKGGWNRTASVLGSKPVATGVTGGLVGPGVSTLSNMAQSGEPLPNPVPAESAGGAALSWGVGGAAMTALISLFGGEGLGLRPMARREAPKPAPEEAALAAAPIQKPPYQAPTLARGALMPDPMTMGPPVEPTLFNMRGEPIDQSRPSPQMDPDALAASLPDYATMAQRETSPTGDVPAPVGHLPVEAEAALPPAPTPGVATPVPAPVAPVGEEPLYDLNDTITAPPEAPNGIPLPENRQASLRQRQSNRPGAAERAPEEGSPANALREQGPTGVLQRQPPGDGSQGGERGRMEQGVQGQETPGAQDRPLEARPGTLPQDGTDQVTPPPARQEPVSATNAPEAAQTPNPEADAHLEAFRAAGGEPAVAETRPATVQVYGKEVPPDLAGRIPKNLRVNPKAPSLIQDAQIRKLHAWLDGEMSAPVANAMAKAPKPAPKPAGARMDVAASQGQLFRTNPADSAQETFRQQAAQAALKPKTEEAGQMDLTETPPPKAIKRPKEQDPRSPFSIIKEAGGVNVGHKNRNGDFIPNELGIKLGYKTANDVPMNLRPILKTNGTGKQLDAMGEHLQGNFNTQHWYDGLEDSSSRSGPDLITPTAEHIATLVSEGKDWRTSDRLPAAVQFPKVRREVEAADQAAYDEYASGQMELPKSDTPPPEFQRSEAWHAENDELPFSRTPGRAPDTLPADVRDVTAAGVRVRVTGAAPVDAQGQRIYGANAPDGSIELHQGAGSDTLFHELTHKATLPGDTTLSPFQKKVLLKAHGGDIEATAQAAADFGLKARAPKTVLETAYHKIIGAVKAVARQFGWTDMNHIYRRVLEGQGVDLKPQGSKIGAGLARMERGSQSVSDYARKNGVINRVLRTFVSKDFDQTPDLYAFVEAKKFADTGERKQMTSVLKEIMPRGMDEAFYTYMDLAMSKRGLDGLKLPDPDGVAKIAAKMKIPIEKAQGYLDAQEKLWIDMGLATQENVRNAMEKYWPDQYRKGLVPDAVKQFMAQIWSQGQAPQSGAKMRHSMEELASHRINKGNRWVVKNGKGIESRTFATEEEATTHATLLQKRNPNKKYEVGAPLTLEEKRARGLLEDIRSSNRRLMAQQRSRQKVGTYRGLADLAMQALDKHGVELWRDAETAREIPGKDFVPVSSLGLNLPHSTDPIITKFNTGYVRADLGEQMAGILGGKSGMVSSVIDALKYAEHFSTFRRWVTDLNPFRHPFQTLVENPSNAMLIPHGPKIFSDAVLWKETLADLHAWAADKPGSEGLRLALENNIEGIDFLKEHVRELQGKFSESGNAPEGGHTAITVALDMLARTGKAGSKVAGALDSAQEGMTWAYHTEDFLHKLHYFKGLMKHEGATPKQAADMVRAFTPDWGNRPTIVRKLSFIPFAPSVAWQWIRIYSNAMAYDPVGTTLKTALMPAAALTIKEGLMQAFGIPDDERKNYNLTDIPIGRHKKFTMGRVLPGGQLVFPSTPRNLQQAYRSILPMWMQPFATGLTNQNRFGTTVSYPGDKTPWATLGGAVAKDVPFGQISYAKSLYDNAHPKNANQAAHQQPLINQALIGPAFGIRKATPPYTSKQSSRGGSLPDLPKLPSLPSLPSLP
jgi:hypothetical protein